jgi:predicted phage terminase large subunit-like protein
MLDRLEGWKVLRYPAIAEEDSRWRKKGEALFPEFKPLDFLLERKALYTTGSWEALYQQNPIVVGGGLLAIEKFQMRPFLDRSNVQRTVRYVDKAASTSEIARYTAMVRMHAMRDGSYVISHVARGKWSALEREEKLKTLAKADAREFANYEVGVEQEPGSGGLESAQATIRNLAGLRVFADKVTGSKELRAEPFAAQVQGGNVALVGGGDWLISWLDECESYPSGSYCDQIDAAAGAFNRLVAKSQYNLDALSS